MSGNIRNREGRGYGIGQWTLGRRLFKLNAEERREIRAKLNELEGETWFDNGELSEQDKAIIEARLDEYDRNPEIGSSWEEAKARILAGLHVE